MPQPTAFVFSSSTFVPGTLGRAEQIDLIFSSVAVGFQILAIQGTDGGSANAYVVTTSGGQNGSYSDGMIVEFKAANSNTGGSTIAVDSGATVSLTNALGQSLAANAISANTWYRCLYNSTYSAFTLIAPAAATVTTSNTISSAAPTNKVGLVAAGGVSTACIPIDITFAIDQSITPTWTGAHIFSNAVTFASTVSFTGGLSLTGGSSQYAATLNGSSSASHSFGLKVAAGTNGNDAAVDITSQSGTQFFEIDGTGSVLVGSPTGGGKGAGTINATGLYVNGVAVSNAVGANPSASVGLSVVNGVATTYMRSDGAPALSQAIAPTWTGAHTFTPSSAVDAVTINAAANDEGLVINGGTNTINHYLMQLLSGQGSGFSSGLLITAGTTSGDDALMIANAANNQDLFYVQGNGESFVVEPPAASTPATSTHQVGYLDAPLNAQGSTYQLVITDRGKFVQMNASTLTIPANSAVAFPIGTTILVYNVQGSGGSNTTIAINTDTLTFLPSGGTGSRALAPQSVATLYKRTATQWLAWGFGLT